MGKLLDYLIPRMEAHTNTCICEGERSITYFEFLGMSHKLACRLNKGQTYGILCTSELNTGIAIFACLLAGAVAVPLSHKYGQAHSESIIKSAGLSRLLCDNTIDIEIIDTDVREKLCDKPNENTAMILYTSGTTGLPKGAMISQENLYYNLTDIENYFQLSNDDTILILRPLYHCAVFTGEFLSALSSGARIHFYSKAFLPAAIATEIMNKTITVIGATPTLHSYLCDIFARLQVPSPLKKVVTSGECMTPAVAEKMTEALPDAQIFNVYGLTEASPRVSYLPPPLFTHNCESVGIPLGHVQIQIADQDGNPVPPGVDGELFVKGKNVMSAYYLNPEETEKKFKNGWLRTGDIACIDENGLLYIKARKDDMIIRAGMNIYPKEVENVLKSHSKIFDVVVYGTKCEDAPVKITADIVAEITLTKKDILRLSKEGLPSYAIPDVVNFVDSIPRNGSGKILRRQGG